MRPIFALLLTSALNRQVDAGTTRLKIGRDSRGRRLRPAATSSD